MADNFQTNAGSGGNTYASDDISSVHYPRVKISWGVDGSAVDASATNPFPISDAGGSLTVDGTVTVQDGGSTISIDDGAGSITVDGTVSISGTVTVGSHAVTNAGTFATQVDGAALTALQLIDNIVLAEDAAHGSGDPGVMAFAVRRDANTSLVGTDGDYAPLQVNADGSLKVAITAGAGSGGTASTDDAAFTAASGSGTPMMGFVTSDSVDSGDVGVVGMLANRQLKVTLYDSGGVELAVGGGTQYTEDASAAANPVGNALIMVRADSLAGVTSADGDNVAARATDKGELYVKHVDALTVNSHAVTNAGTFAVQESGAALTALQLIDNIVLAEDAAHVSADPGVMMLAVRRDTVAVGSGTDGDYSTLNVNASGRLYASATVDAALPAGTNNIGDVDVLSIAAGDNNIGNVDIVTMPNVTLAAGTNTNEVVGDAAHDAAIAGNPVRIAGRALTSDYTAVAAGDTADLITTLLGKLVTIPYANPANTWSYAAASGGITNTTGVSAKAAAGAGIRNYITHCQVINGHATVDTDVQIRDGASGTVLWRGFAKAAGGGVSANFNPPLRGTANTLVEVACGTTGSATYFNLQGFVAAE